MKYYSNPKYSEYIKDENFVKKLIEDRNSQERKDVIAAILGIVISAAVFLSSWLAVIILEG